MIEYDLYIFGGSIGEGKDATTKHFPGVGTGRYYGTFSSKPDAQDAGRSYVNSFSGGHRNYYHPKYRVIEKSTTTSKKVEVDCPKCLGTGQDTEGEDCTRCDGTGGVIESMQTGKSTCPKCKSDDVVKYHNNTYMCMDCSEILYYDPVDDVLIIDRG
jgi:RecJ-like exonuclease